jgi:Glycosyl transferase family 2
MAHRPSLALAFATIERPQAAQRLIRSVRKYFPQLPIYVADQSRHVDAMSTFYAANNVTLLQMAYDAGVAASRNRLFEALDVDYVVLCDDDFILGAATDFREAVQILEADLEIGIVGGRLYDFDGANEWVRNWELFLEYDERQKILFTIPIYDLAPKVREVSGIRYYLCDAVLNFAVFRRTIFGAGVRWDERFHSNGEHEDFYLNIKLNFPYRVAHLPTMVAYHHHPEEYRAYRAVLRDRNEGWRRFFEKWHLEQHVEFGFGVRTIDDVSAAPDPDTTRSRFFLNADLSLRRPAASAGTLLIGDFEKIASVGVLDQAGDPLSGSPAMDRLLLDPRSRRLVAVPSENEGLPPRLAATPAELEERYYLEAGGDAPVVGFINPGLYFRYDPVLRNDSDFFVWYRRDPDDAGGRAIRQRLAVVARWSASDGSLLVWKSRRMYFDLDVVDYWRACLVEVPMLPRGCNWLRFDIVADGGPSPDPICAGFLFACGDGHFLRALDIDGDVLGFSRLPNDGAAPGEPGRPLEEVGRTCRALPVAAHPVSSTNPIMLLRIDELPGFEVVFLVGWNGLGRSLISGRLPRPALRAPGMVAVPRAAWCPPASRIFAYGSNGGLAALTPRADPTSARYGWT